MTTRVQVQVANVGTPSGVTLDTAQRATVTSHELLVIPDSWKGRFVRFECLGTTGSPGYAVVRFGSADTVQAALTASTRAAGPSPAAGTLTAAGTEAHLVIPEDSYRDERIDPTWTHLSHLSGATGGLLVMTVKTGDEN